jgi:hypothetical protein
MGLPCLFIGQSLLRETGSVHDIIPFDGNETQEACQQVLETPVLRSCNICSAALYVHWRLKQVFISSPCVVADKPGLPLCMSCLRRCKLFVVHPVTRMTMCLRVELHSLGYVLVKVISYV